jgi:hypothetical protein
LRRRRCSGLGFARTGHDGGIGETLERRQGFIGRPRGVLVSGPEAKQIAGGFGAVAPGKKEERGKGTGS